ncbi:hypothetical protein GGI25_001576 [Coemansia spiralis]|uniref:Uncharacterized protein n=2 Tax=Coemansia TaxID=4863 RepID=A0A9W8GAA2_9FUNG|nr:hypothetical protein BX070DRAFT_227101 [Coemansia spiralis]KAJ1993685.1 hypothetical protein EDC05_002078 [Coemansia umbellata]KAJ2622948.1 hypothetical protein GGI26_002749 [Coemansia sp. RSA 1358]KAJ2679441.1 hypothetical protein GGI25_001576 [Coemansia spiralis]
MSKIAKEILLKGEVPPTVKFDLKPKTLYELLNIQRLNAYKFKAQPQQWYKKGFDGCYWEVFKVKFKKYKSEPTHGKAWGLLYWNGEALDNTPKEIKGGLKFSWQEYRSPKKDGVFYDAETAKDIERRRTKLIKDFYKS